MDRTRCCGGRGGQGGGKGLSVSAERIRVSGVVQGVGFRPFVWRLANELDVSGWVRNDAAGVEINAEGSAEHLCRLRERLRRDAPPLARVDSVEARAAPALGQHGFTIIDSVTGGAANTTAIGHDTAMCGACVAELCDPTGRRWRHAFITCTHCGPRYTVTRRLPYDRPQTSLAAFPLCADCAREYGDPGDRRFHAETTCCPACGPQLALLGIDASVRSGDPLAETLALLMAGGIVAIKGLGGFHLLCDARNPRAVTALRERKAREEKPFAVLLANSASAREFAVLGEAERELLESAERPIVLLAKRAAADTRLAGVAPGLAWLGAMLPATPLQLLLFHEAAGRPAGIDWMSQVQALALVCTSANPGGEPLVTGNGEALLRLAGIADAVLLHDRDIVVRCDDSVLRAAAGGSQFIRRARGYTPRAIPLALSGPSVLALGGWFKNTVCVTRGAEAFVSQHVGDLDNAAGCAYLEETVTHLLAILEVEPQLVVHDLHPDFHSSRFAAEFAAVRGIPAIAVQHHHAHVAAVLAEHRHAGPALGLALDGVGLGSDGQAWGGEFLRVDGAHFERLGHLVRLALPGGDRAAREPWRMAAAALQALGRNGEIARRFAAQPGAGVVGEMLARDIRAPRTSSMGRLFDAAAGLLGVRQVASFEGQAAMLLEGLAAAHGEAAALADGWRINADGQLDLTPLLAALATCDDPGQGAALFHATVVAALTAWVDATARTRGDGISTVACGGGCFLNHILSRGLMQSLTRRGFKVLMARQLPPNDGGLSLGQAWIALQQMRGN